ncbi:hypothetical protein AAC387_Pa07g2558 [Persea americana]
MYFIERYLLTLKSYVRNRSRPEGSIAEGYLAEECLTFCSREHRKKINTNNRHKRQIDREHMRNDQFPKWFESHVDRLRLEGDERVTTDLRLLARGPSKENAYGEENGHVSKFEIATDEQPRVKKWVFDKICQFWKNWKSKLKKTHYDPFHTTRERLQYRPDRVDPVQWVLLIEFWGIKDGMERSKRNAENRALQTMNHTAGTKCFARIRDEERARNPDGQALDRMEMFRLTHTRRVGRLVDRASEDALR